MKKKVTMQQIADYLGVSKFVVSKALSGKGGVSEETRERVFKVASQLGYVSPSQKQKRNRIPNNQLTAPMNNEKQTVLILMPNVRYQTKESFYWGKITDSITETLKKAGLGIVILTQSSAENISTLINPHAFLGVIGVGFVPTAILLEINRFGLPIVLIDHEDPLVPTDTIFINNFDASASLTNLLIGIGHDSLGFVGNYGWSRSFKDRWLGFRTTLEENQLYINRAEHFVEVNGAENEETTEEIYVWLKKRDQQNSLPTALVCSNDAIAKCAVDAIQQLGYNVPQDISLTGFDNTEDSYLIDPTITTIDVPKKEMGSRAVEMLLRRIERSNTSFEKIILMTTIIYRESIMSKKTNKDKSELV